MSHSNAANYLFLCRRASHESFLIKRLGVWMVIYSMFERAIAFECLRFFFLFLIFWMKRFYDCKSWEKVSQAVNIFWLKKPLSCCVVSFPGNIYWSILISVGNAWYTFHFEIFSHVTICFHTFHQNIFFNFFASNNKQISLSFLICFGSPFANFAYDESFSILGSIKCKIFYNWLHF